MTDDDWVNKAIDDALRDEVAQREQIRAVLKRLRTRLSEQ